MEWSVQKVDACTCNTKKKKKPGIDDEEEKKMGGRRVEKRSSAMRNTKIVARGDGGANGHYMI